MSDKLLVMSLQQEVTRQRAEITTMQIRLNEAEATEHKLLAEIGHLRSVIADSVHKLVTKMLGEDCAAIAFPPEEE